MSSRTRDSDRSPPLPDPATALPELAAAARDLEDSLIGLGGRGSGIRRLRELWLRTPMPEPLPRPAAVVSRAAWTAVLLTRGELPMALSEERIAWVQARCKLEQPGVVRPIREPRDADAERLLSSELELLRKKGRSPFS